ncbi:MAG: hypothetical protein ABI720_08405, partial [Actinomycetes bacterium]
RKDRVLLETLRWSENELAEQRRAELARFRAPWRAIERFVDLYLPVSPVDARWNLWAQVSARPPEDAEGQAQIAALEQAWVADLADWVRRGIESGAFPASDSASDAAAEREDASGLALRWVLLMNGIAEQVRLGAPGHGAQWARSYALAVIASDLGAG